MTCMYVYIVLIYTYINIIMYMQSGKYLMECRKLRDCRPMNTTAKWKDDMPAIP